MSGYRVPDPNDPNDERNDDDYGMNAVGGPEPRCLICGHLWGSHQGEVGAVPCRSPIRPRFSSARNKPCNCTPFVWPDGLRADNPQ